MYLALLKQIDTSVPAKLDIHRSVNNYATDKHRAVKRWVAMPPRVHVHNTPTYASWLNQVEIWLNIIIQQAPAGERFAV